MAIDENDEFYFIIKKLKTVCGFSPHFYAYEVIPTEHFFLLKSQDICAYSSFPPLKKIANGNLYVVYN